MADDIETAWANAVRAATRRAKGAPSWWDSELEWYANARDGEMGIHGMPLEPSTGSSSGDQTSDGISDRQVRAATRSRLLEGAMAKLPPDTRLLLLAVHTVLSPRAHKDKHAAQARCVKAREGEIMVAVAVFRRQQEYLQAVRVR